MCCEHNVVNDSIETGEIIFADVHPQITGRALQITNPVKVILNGAWNIISGTGLAFRDKKKWIPALILAVIWFALMLLSILNINHRVVRIISWLTFANSGLGIYGKTGIMEIIGGVIGKGIVAGFMFSLFSSGAIKSAGSGLKTMISCFSCKNMGQMSILLLGTGLALVSYNFMAGAAILSMSMSGIAAFVLLLQALGKETGFLHSFFGGLTASKAEVGMRINTAVVNRIIAGMAAGFALSVPLSALNIFNLPYLLGGLVFISGLITGVVEKSRRGAGTK